VIPISLASTKREMKRARSLDMDNNNR